MCKGKKDGCGGDFEKCCRKKEIDTQEAQAPVSCCGIEKKKKEDKSPSCCGS